MRRGQVLAVIAGVGLVDTKLANWGQAILDKVRTVSDKPITHIINTHTHGDHIGSNEFFASSVEIVTQANTGTNMAKMKNFATPETKHGMPDRTFTDRMTVLSGKEAIDLYYFGPGHSTVMAWADFVEFGEFNRAFLAAVQASIKAGKTADQALADLKLPEKFAAYRMNGATDNVAKIYAELGK